ncbi:hypothetical protein LCGC14_1111650 [marine sediment metagenome]|uniref:Uncharacterized protein n=1 Tax=marine sediment metagenome TaxID=412755 RepID=A0A0F9MUF4_9ZZZZ
MSNQSGTIGTIEEALDKLAYTLGFTRGSPRENEFWTTTGNSVLQELYRLHDEVKSLHKQCRGLDTEVFELRVKDSTLERELAGKRDKRARIW